MINISEWYKPLNTLIIAVSLKLLGELAWEFYYIRDITTWLALCAAWGEIVRAQFLFNRHFLGALHTVFRSSVEEDVRYWRESARARSIYWNWRICHHKRSLVGLPQPIRLLFAGTYLRRLLWRSAHTIPRRTVAEERCFSACITLLFYIGQCMSVFGGPWLVVPIPNLQNPLHVQLEQGTKYFLELIWGSAMPGRIRGFLFRHVMTNLYKLVFLKIYLLLVLYSTLSRPWGPWVAFNSSLLARE